MLFDIVNIKYAHFRGDIYMIAIAMQLFMTSLFITFRSIMFGTIQPNLLVNCCNAKFVNIPWWYTIGSIINITNNTLLYVSEPFFIQLDAIYVINIVWHRHGDITAITRPFHLRFVSLCTECVIQDRGTLHVSY